MAIRGTLPVLPTPFLNGGVDYQSIERMLDYTLPYVDGYTLLGSTGEAPSMTLKERMETAEFILNSVPSDKTVVIGIAHTSAADAVLLARHAQGHGAKGVLLPVPYYFPNTSGGAFTFISEVDRILDIDLVLYDNPVTTKTTLSAQTVIEWAHRLRRLRTVKITDHDVAKIADWKRAGLTVLAGDDVILFRYLTAAVDGSMVLAPAIFPATFKDVWGRIQQGDLPQAFAIFAAEILPFLHVFGVGDEIPTTKALFHDLGLFTSSELRPPLEGVDAQRRDLLRLAYARSDEQARQRRLIANDEGDSQIAATAPPSVAACPATTSSSPIPPPTIGTG
jgi:4-hydroxy-tetrahydrodipicolinate synthase